MSIKAGVIGYPITHSLSPIIHNYWLEKYGIGGSYEKIEILPENLESFIRSLSKNRYAGVNVTIPHKEESMKIVDKLSSCAQQIGAVNTITVKEGKIIGDNSDWIGFSKNIEKADFATQKAVILGAGGAARAIIYALIKLHFKDIILLNRTKNRAEELCNAFSNVGNSKIEAIDWGKRDNILENTNILVNTTSLGMVGQDELVINLEKLPKEALVTDIVFNPLTTNILQQAKARNNPTVDGLGMLLHQAAPGFKAWFDPEDKKFSGLPEVNDELRNIVLEKM